MSSGRVFRPKKRVLCRACEKEEFIRNNPGAVVNLLAYYHTCSKALPPTLGVRFAQASAIVNDQYLCIGSRGKRVLQGIRRLYRRIKRYFFPEPPMIWPRKWITKEEALKLYPQGENHGNNQTEK